MSSKNDHLDARTTLRHDAEKDAGMAAPEPPNEPTAVSPDEIARRLHELHALKIDLEAQGDALRRAQADFEAQRERYANLYDIAPMGHCILDAQGRVLRANLAAAALLGVDKKDLVQRSFNAFVAAPDCAIHSKRQERLYKTREPQDYEVRLVKPDGTAFWSRLMGCIVQHPNGEFLRHFILSDFSETKGADEALRQSEQTLRAVLDGLASNIALLDSDGVIQLVNQAWRDFARQNGLSAETVSEGRNYLAACDAAMGMGSEGALEFAAGIRDVICGKAQEFAMEYPCHGPNVRRWFIGRATPFSDAAPRSVIVAHEDISGRKLAEEAVVNTAKMDALGVFSGGIAHDFNNILGMIFNRATLALLAQRSDTTLCEHMKQILRATERGKSLIRQILDYSRPGLGALASLDLGAVAESTASFIEAALPGNITLRLERQTAPLPVQGNATQLTQVLMNLGANAVKAMQQGGTLTLRLARDKAEGQAVLVVEDTGCGMTEEVRARIFEPYYTTRSGGRGSGLGLAVVHGIVKNHHGSICCESSPGCGARITCRLPLCHGEDQPAEIAPEGCAQAIPYGPSQGRRVMFVDDEAELACTSHELLQSFGHQPTVYTSPARALADFARDPQGFDVVILDLLMPGMSGQDLALELLALNPDVPIILCTGNSNVISEGQALSLGIKGYLPKPLDWLELDELIGKLSTRTGSPSI